MSAFLPLLLPAAFWSVLFWWGDRIASDPEAGVALLALLPIVFAVRRAPLEGRDSAKGRPRTPSPDWRTLLLLAAYVLLFHALPPIFRAALAILAISNEFLLRRTGAPLAPASALLALLALPAGPSLDFVAGFPLRAFVAAATAGILDLYGYAVAREGAALRWGTEIVAVDAPCSGIRILWAGAVLVLSIALLRRITGVRLALLGGAAFLLLLAANVVRATALFLLHASGRELTDSLHEGIGLAVFALVAAGIAALLRGERKPLCDAASS